MTARNQAAQKRKMFLGGAIDPISGKRTDSDVIYDADNLTTHGIIVGMTGSGKTGLGIVMLEEALTIGIPCLILDPKGDMGNLLLNFPSFSPENFLPWINESEVKSSGIDLDQQAIQTCCQLEVGARRMGNRYRKNAKVGCLCWLCHLHSWICIWDSDQCGWFAHCSQAGLVRTIASRDRTR